MGLIKPLRGSGVYFAGILSMTEEWIGKPVIDETGYSGNYNVKLGHFDGKEELQKAILDKWGLELIASNMPIDKLIVEKTKK